MRKPMTYFLDLFTPETWEAFKRNGSNVSGFRYRQRRMAKENIHPGDYFLCYLVGVSRWCGLFRITSEAYEDSSPIFADPDPFTIRFKVTPEVMLSPEQAIPIFEDGVWNKLKETRGIEKGAKGWAKYYRGSLRRMDDADGELLATWLKNQSKSPHPYPFTDRDRRLLARRKVKTLEGEVTVVVPEAEEEDEELEAAVSTTPDVRQSLQIQAKLVEIGAAMHFHVWVPRGDRGRVRELVAPKHHPSFLNDLPLSYEINTLETIEQIDVLWLKGRSIARAFEVEHTTAVYSGLLRMADLLALQPNMDIRLHIVAPEERRDKVFREMLRPVFSLLDRGPLSKMCTFMSYESVEAIRGLEHLPHTSDSIIEEYEEDAEG
jgi:hypothetical protein